MKVFAFNVVSNGVWKKAFAIGAVVYEDDKESKKFYAKCPIEQEPNWWLSENVLPKMEEAKITHSSYESMLKEFAKFYLENKNYAKMIVENGFITESKVIFDMHELGYINDYAGHVVFEILSSLEQAGYKGDSIGYNKEHNINVPVLEAGGSYNPVYKARAIAYCYMDLISNK